MKRRRASPDLKQAGRYRGDLPENRLPPAASRAGAAGTGINQQRSLGDDVTHFFKSKPIILTCLICGLMTVSVVATPASAMPPIEFHGYLETNAVVRDTNGFQYGFLDEGETIQQRNTFKFDLDVRPDEPIAGPFTLSKIHLTYRGAYDSIFDLRSDTYDDIRDGSPSRHDAGKDDIRFENDLREASFDISFDGDAGYGFIRPGKQLVSWGETMGFNLLDQFNPSDNSFQMFFTNPDELKIPQWMVRANYSLPAGDVLSWSIDTFFTFDERANRYAPLDAGMSAPYAFLFRDLQGLTVREDVPDEKEYGIKVTSEIGDYLSVSLVYFHGTVNEGEKALVFKNMVMTPGGPMPTAVDFTHPVTDIFGGFFSTYLTAVDVVLKGEFAWSTDEPFRLSAASPDLDMVDGQAIARGVRTSSKMSWMLGADKKVWMRWLSDANMINLGIQWIHYQIMDWEEALEAENEEHTDLITFNASWQCGPQGSVSPKLFLAYDLEGTLMSTASVKYEIDKNWYTQVSQISFWGDKEATSEFTADLIGASELAFKVGYQW